MKTIFASGYLAAMILSMVLTLTTRLSNWWLLFDVPMLVVALCLFGETIRQTTAKPE